jgi:hypothetical protein
MIDTFIVYINTEQVKLQPHLSYNLLNNITEFYKHDDDNIYTAYKQFEYLKPFINYSIEFNPNNLTITYDNTDVYFNSHLLDLNKTNYNVLEKYIYDTVFFHFNRMNLSLTDDFSIEFSLNQTFKRNTPLHFDHQHIDNILFNNYDSPFLSILTYLDDSIFPTVFTNLTSFQYKKDKNFNEQLVLSFPKNGKQVCFNGGTYLHGPCNVFDKMLNINLLKGHVSNRFTINIFCWNKKIKFIPFFPDLIYSPSVFNKQDKLLCVDYYPLYYNKYIQTNAISSVFSNVTRKITPLSYFTLGKILIENECESNVWNNFFFYK